MMIPAGYMAKRVASRPDWLGAQQVVDIYSVSGCVSKNVADYTAYWKHNGYWLFDAPEIIQQLAREDEIDLRGRAFFYYEVFAHEFDEEVEPWREVEPVASIRVKVTAAPEKGLAGYDVVSFTVGTNAECSPLSCTRLAEEVETNAHCLLASLEQAQELLTGGAFTNTEPGPSRIFAVYPVAWS
jgi:hypothetical protein